MRIVYGLSLLVIASAFATAEELTVDSLILRSPSISSEDDSYKSIELIGKMQWRKGAFLGFHVCYRSPDKYSLLLTDYADGTPLMLLADGQGLCYEPVRPSVIYFPQSRPRFSVGVRKGNRYYIEVGTANLKDAPSLVALDLKSLLLVSRQQSDLKKTNHGYQLQLLDGKAGVVLEVEPSKTHPETSVKVLYNDEPAIEVQAIRINEDVSDDHFKFPDLAELRKQVSVQELSESSGTLKTLDGTAMMMRGLYIRGAISHPELREKIDKIDWDKVAESDKAFSKHVRDALALEAR